MKRVRLDVGAVTVAENEDGNFIFFLYNKESMNKCLSVDLTSHQMHTVLTMFKKISENSISIHSLFGEILREFKVELLEVMIERDEREECFISKLLFFDGEVEVNKEASFADGLILSKYFSCPIYISSDLLEQYATDIELVSNEVVKTESYVEKLKEDFKEAIKSEDYERAALISKEITKFGNN